MLRAYKYRIYPTEEQKVLFAKTFGCCRFVYNWALNLKIEAYKQDKKSVAYKEVQDRMVNELKKENQWLTEVNSQALLNSIRNLDTAYKNFFRDTHAVGFPKFKSRKSKQSFQCPQHCNVDFVIVPFSKSTRQCCGQRKLCLSLRLLKRGKPTALVLRKKLV